MKGMMIIVALLTVFFSSCTEQQEKTVYVKIGELYEEFSLKKELETKFDATKLARQNVLDSLKLELELMVISIQKTDNPELQQSFSVKRNSYMQKEQTFREENERLEQEYNDQIWKQINQFVEEYGKENELDYVLGAEGSGVIMYGKNSKNRTPELIEYINNKYSGKQG